MRQGFNTAASRYTAEDLYQKRETFQSDAEKIIRSLLEPEGFKVEQIVILGTMRLPNSVMQNVEAKVNAKQLSLKKQEELAQAQADAAKKIAETEGYAQSLKIQAEAEAYANKVRQESLTPMLIQQQFIEKWDGKLPVYGEVPKIFKDVSGR
jgi:regulator of protease activity HflC (stomatin/prohibitin superfamily)